MSSSSLLTVLAMAGSAHLAIADIDATSTVGYKYYEYTVPVNAQYLSVFSSLCLDGVEILASPIDASTDTIRVELLTTSATYSAMTPKVSYLTNPSTGEMQLFLSSVGEYNALPEARFIVHVPTTLPVAQLFNGGTGAMTVDGSVTRESGTTVLVRGGNVMIDKTANARLDVSNEGAGSVCLENFVGGDLTLVNGGTGSLLAMSGSSSKDVSVFNMGTGFASACGVNAVNQAGVARGTGNVLLGSATNSTSFVSNGIAQVGMVNSEAVKKNSVFGEGNAFMVEGGQCSSFTGVRCTNPLPVLGSDEYVTMYAASRALGAFKIQCGWNPTTKSYENPFKADGMIDVKANVKPDYLVPFEESTLSAIAEAINNSTGAPSDTVTPSVPSTPHPELPEEPTPDIVILSPVPTESNSTQPTLSDEETDAIHDGDDVATPTVSVPTTTDNNNQNTDGGLTASSSSNSTNPSVVFDDKPVVGSTSSNTTSTDSDRNEQGNLRSDADNFAMMAGLLLSMAAVVYV